MSGRRKVDSLFESYGFEIVTGTVTDVDVPSETVKLTTVPLAALHAAAVTVNWPVVVNKGVFRETRFAFEVAVTL